MADAAVIVLYERVSKSLILTLRSEHVHHHPGEICFPGGLRQPLDKDLSQTALRETNEELGISMERIEILRSMPKEQTLTGFCISPWFARIETIEPFSLQKNEVEELIKLPFIDVLNMHNYQEIMVQRGGFSIKSMQYAAYQEGVIWGATARIMRQLANNAGYYGEILSLLY